MSTSAAPSIQPPTAFEIPDAEELRALRVDSDETQVELAARAGVSTDSIRRAEQGRSDPRLSTVRKVADAYGRGSNIPTADALASMRVVVGLSQSETARRAGMSQRSVSYIERNETDPQISTVRELLQVYEEAMG